MGECMRAHATRLRIITNHKNICVNSGKVKVIENSDTATDMAEKFNNLYKTDKNIKKYFKKDFKKRCILKRSDQINATQPEFKLIIVIMIALIYAVTLIIMKTAQEQPVMPQTNDIIKTNQANSGGSREEVNINWSIQNRDKDRQDWKKYKKSRFQEKK